MKTTGMYRVVKHGFKINGEFRDIDPPETVDKYQTWEEASDYACKLRQDSNGECYSVEDETKICAEASPARLSSHDTGIAYSQRLADKHKEKIDAIENGLQLHKEIKEKVRHLIEKFPEADCAFYPGTVDALLAQRLTYHTRLNKTYQKNADNKRAQREEVIKRQEYYLKRLHHYQQEDERQQAERLEALAIVEGLGMNQGNIVEGTANGI